MGKASFRKPAMPLLGNVYHVPYGDADAVEQQLRIAREVGNEIAAVVMEPVQGEAGAIVPPDDFWPRLRQLCDEYDVLLIADEVQTGLGRTGALWGVNHWNVTPDIICSAKALGGGVMPIGAFMASKPCGSSSLTSRSSIRPPPAATRWPAPPPSPRSTWCWRKTCHARPPRRASTSWSACSRWRRSTTPSTPRITGKGLLIGQHFRDAETAIKWPPDCSSAAC